MIVYGLYTKDNRKIDYTTLFQKVLNCWSNIHRLKLKNRVTYVNTLRHNLKTTNVRDMTRDTTLPHRPPFRIGYTIPIDSGMS